MNKMCQDVSYGFDALKRYNYKVLCTDPETKFCVLKLCDGAQDGDQNRPNIR